MSEDWPITITLLFIFTSREKSDETISTSPTKPGECTSKSINPLPPSSSPMVRKIISIKYVMDLLLFNHSIQSRWERMAILLLQFVLQTATNAVTYNAKGGCRWIHYS